MQRIRKVMPSTKSDLFYNQIKRTTVYMGSIEHTVSVSVIVKPHLE